MATNPPPAPEKLNPLAEKAKELEESILEPVNAVTRFSTDPDKNIRLLANEAFPDDTAEQERYAGKIKASLEKHLKDGMDIEKLWKYLKDNYCETTAIIEGILRCFEGEVGEKEIGIAQFLKPVRIEAESILHKTLSEERKMQISSTKLALNDLLAKIKKNPDFPIKNA